MAKIDIQAEILRRVRTSVHVLKNQLRDRGVDPDVLDGIDVLENDGGVLVSIDSPSGKKKTASSGTKTGKAES